jgi:hypothetical protein
MSATGPATSQQIETSNEVEQLALRISLDWLPVAVRPHVVPAGYAGI